MNKKEIFKGLSILAEIQLAQTPPIATPEKAKGLINAWHLFLAPYSYEQFEVAIYLYVKNNIFFPTPAALISYMPLPDDYLAPEVAYNSYMTEKLDREDPSCALMIKTVSELGYTQHYINQSDTRTRETTIRPKIEKRYRENVERDRIKNDLKMISNIKQIEGKEHEILER